MGVGIRSHDKGEVIIVSIFGFYLFYKLAVHLSVTKNRGQQNLTSISIHTSQMGLRPRGHCLLIMPSVM